MEPKQLFGLELLLGIASVRSRRGEGKKKKKNA
jgi:hypothetical protein